MPINIQNFDFQLMVDLCTLRHFSEYLGRLQNRHCRAMRSSLALDYGFQDFQVW